MLLQKHLPKLSNHLTLYNIPLQLITLSWFLTGYISTLPFEVMLIINYLFSFSEKSIIDKQSNIQGLSQGLGLSLVLWKSIFILCWYLSIKIF